MDKPNLPLARRPLLTLAGGLLVAAASSRRSLAAPAPEIQVLRAPNCDCCLLWGRYLEREGFTVTMEEKEDMRPFHAMAGLPDHLVACHTAFVERYVVAGHVPAPAIRRLLAERPEIQGIAVPGMPAGSPGMPSPEPETYEVIAYGAAGEEVFVRFRGHLPL